MTWVQISKLRQEGATDINCGGYLNTMLKARLENIPYKELAISVIMNAPEYVDEVVEETAGYQSIKAAQKLALTIEQNKKTPKPTLENNEFLDNVQRYWCGFKDEKCSVGKNQLQLRRIRIPNNRIVFEDAAKSRITFEQLMEQLPPLEDLFGFRNRTTERIRELRSQKANGVFPHS